MPLKSAILAILAYFRGIDHTKIAPVSRDQKSAF